MIKPLQRFFKSGSAGGILLVMATFLALLFANTGLSTFYDLLLNIPVEIRLGEFEIAKPLLLWINDGLMAIFFFMIGLELKGELIDGQLSKPDKLILPVVAAIGGMAVPALVYAYFNWGDESAMGGWAIPTATDIAFALGIMSLLGNRVPTALKIFLVSLAIIDDIGAIIIIALFYTSNLSLLSLAVAGSCLAILFAMNRRGVMALAPYLLIGVIMWASVLKSGVHATLAGVALAFFIPYKTPDGRSPVKEMEHELHPSVAFVILPIFAFANAGVEFDERAATQLFTGIPLGIALGLFFGKQAGVFLFSWIAVKLRIAPEPDISWKELYGVAILCGVGFTMSLFIGSLAFEQGGENYLAVDRMGILIGSGAAAVFGYLYLNKILPKNKDNH
mgnify:FL=1